VRLRPRIGSGCSRPWWLFRSHVGSTEGRDLDPVVFHRPRPRTRDTRAALADAPRRRATPPPGSVRFAARAPASTAAAAPMSVGAGRPRPDVHILPAIAGSGHPSRSTNRTGVSGQRPLRPRSGDKPRHRKDGAPDWIRTSDLCLRSVTSYVFPRFPAIARPYLNS